MRRLLSVLCFTLLPLAALAAGQSPDAGAAGTHIPMDYVMAPLTGANGKLIGYAYISARLTASSEAAIGSVSDKKPFIQDAFIRDVNARSIASAADPEAVDVTGLEARMLADATRVMGPGKVKQITVCTVNVAELHPIQTPSPAAPDSNGDADAHRNPLKSRCESEKPA